jgi:hypothetical protein
MNFSRTPVVTLLALSGAALAQFSCTPSSKQSQVKKIDVEVKLSATDGFKAVAELKGEAADALIASAGKQLDNGNLSWELAGAATIKCSVVESNGRETAPSGRESPPRCQAFEASNIGRGGSSLGQGAFELEGKSAKALLAEIKGSMPDSVTKEQGKEIAEVKGRVQIRCVKLGDDPTQCLIAVNQSSDVPATVLNLDKELAFEIQKQTKKFANFEGEFSGAGKLACSTVPLRCEASADGAQASWFMLGGPTEPLAIKLIEKLKDAGVTDDRSGNEGLKLSGKITIFCLPVGGPRCTITVEPIPE